MIRFLLINAFISIHSLLASLWGIFLSAFDRNGSIVHRYCAVPWAKTILFVCGVKVEVRGAENINAASPRIYMSNHQSYFDIFTLLAALPVSFKFILKQELMKIPLLGWAMKGARYISIDREDGRKAIISINNAAEKIKNGASVLIFPEGTRSEDGIVGEFKKGGFLLAMKSGCDVVPVAISGSRNVVPKGSRKVNKGTIFLNIGKPIPLAECSKREMNQFIERVRDEVVKMVHGS
jgi:1-acyl-sn-glycerol-3-phosphate acyltransferase